MEGLTHRRHSAKVFHPRTSLVPLQLCQTTCSHSSSIPIRLGTLISQKQKPFKNKRKEHSLRRIAQIAPPSPRHINNSQQCISHPSSPLSSGSRLRCASPKQFTPSRLPASSVSSFHDPQGTGQPHDPHHGHYGTAVSRDSHLSQPTGTHSAHSSSLKTKQSSKGSA